MTAFSESVSTTLKFSIVAAGAGKKIKVVRLRLQSSDNQAAVTLSKTAGLTLPVQSDGGVPEVVAHLVAGHSLHRVCGFERIQHNAVLLHFSPVHLLHNTEGRGRAVEISAIFAYSASQQKHLRACRKIF